MTRASRAVAALAALALASCSGAPQSTPSPAASALPAGPPSFRETFKNSFLAACESASSDPAMPKFCICTESAIEAKYATDAQLHALMHARDMKKRVAAVSRGCAAQAGLQVRPV